ncbi:MAG: biopolymer transporter ExbD [Akkermansiaceae bacterium]|jgi:biopolymer transport protein ExbD
MRIRDTTPPPVGFQLAPMIDIVFLLLIFFLVTYQITEQEKDLSIALPSTSEGSQDARVANKIVINLSNDNVITISGQVLTQEELREKLEEIVRFAELAGKDAADRQPIRIRVDRETKSDALLKLVDEIRSAGIWNIDFATSMPKPE